MKKVAFIVMLILFMVIDAYTLYLMSPDLLFPHKSIYITNQDDDIAKRVKAYFSIQYEISKIVYRQGFPDGYYLDVYDVGGEKHEEFDDTFNVPESDTIQEYEYSGAAEPLFRKSGNRLSGIGNRHVA